MLINGFTLFTPIEVVINIKKDNKMGQNEISLEQYKEFLKKCESYIPLKKRFTKESIDNSRLKRVKEYKLFMESYPDCKDIYKIEERIRVDENDNFINDYYVGPFIDQRGEFYLSTSYWDDFCSYFSITISSFFGKKEITVKTPGDFEKAMDIYREITNYKHGEVNLSLEFNDQEGIIDSLNL